MSAYILTIVLTALICLINTKRKKTIAVVLLTILWGALYAFRYYVGTDFESYFYMYQRIGNQSLVAYMTSQRDTLFAAITYICHRLSNGNWIFYQSIVAMLIYVPVLIVFSDQNDDMTISCLLYIFTLSLFSGYNGARQEIALGITFLAYFRFYLRGKKFWYYLFMLLAFGFHSSVIFCLPIFYLSKKRFNLFSMMLVSAIFFIIYLFIWQLWPLLISFLRAIGQTKMAEDYAQVAQDQGSGLLRLIVTAVPLLIGLWGETRLKVRFPNINNEIVLTLFSVLFMLLSMRYWIFARVAAYFALARLTLMPKLKYAFTSGGSRNLFVFFMLGLYFLYMILMLLHGEGHYYPYELITTY